MENIDIVITWVNWSDKYFVKKLIEAGGRSEGCDDGEFIELKYLLRSIKKHNVKHRNIYIVHSDNHAPPKYLREVNNLYFIKHSMIVKDKSHLPLVHRESILINLHRIPNLSDIFFYFEDDLLVSNNQIFNDVYTNYLNRKLFAVGNRSYEFERNKSLWIQASYNSHKIILDDKFNPVLYGSPVLFLHNIQILDKSVIFELEKMYPKEFEISSKHKNKDEERHDVVNIVSFFTNYLVYKKGYKMLEPFQYHCIELHTNGLTDDNINMANVYKFKHDLNKATHYNIIDIQGNGVSDEYPKCDVIRKIYLDWVEKTYPEKTEYEL